ALEDRHVVAVGGELELAHAVDVDDRGAVDAYEALGVEARLEVADGAAHQVGAAVDAVDAHVVVGGVDPLDVIDAQEADPPRRAQRQAVERLLALSLVVGEGAAAQLAPLQLLAYAAEGGAEALLVERLEQVVDGVDVEGAQGVLLV